MFDFPHLKFDHGEEIDMLRDTVARFVADQITPRAAEIDATNSFPDDIWRKLGDLGLLGITAPEEVGGTGLGYLAHVIAARPAWGSATAPTPTCASTRSCATATPSRRPSTCPS